MIGGLWILCAFISAAALSRHNRAGTGFLLGAILGPLGLIVAIVMRGDANRKIEQARHAEVLEAMRGKTAQ